MRFLISESAYIDGVYIPCPPGQVAVLVLPNDSPHVSIRWKPLDAAARAAQVRVKQPVKNDLTGGIELPATKITSNNATVIPAKGWAGHPIVEQPTVQADGETPVKTFVHEDIPAPLDQIELRRNQPTAEALQGVVKKSTENPLGA